MAMGCPVMATSWGGAKESVQHGITGWILNPLDADAWRTQMAWCIKNKAELDTYGKAGRERMRTFDLTAMLRKLKDVYAL
jgi:glycosyltransferase involved in cell wall biosynthesis